MTLITRSRASILASVLLMLMSAAVAQQAGVTLRIEATQLRNGIPDTIDFIFENSGSLPIRVPPVGRCGGPHSGVLSFHLEAIPRPRGIGHGSGGGCFGIPDHEPPITEQAMRWKVVPAHGSLAVSLSGAALLVSHEADGKYALWGEYEPPPLTPDELLALRNIGLDFVATRLTSQRLEFIKATE